MCDPIAISTMALHGASEVISHQGEKAAVSRQNEYNEQTRRNANAATAEQYVQTQRQLLQSQQAAAEEKGQVAKDARAAQATAIMAAGEAGVGGFSVQALINEFAGRVGDFNSSVDRQLSWEEEQARLTLNGLEAQGQDRINSAPAVARPSFFDNALRIGGAATSAYTGYRGRQHEQGYS